jgi:aminotransferase in exopolysaccharide biosynthesis
MISIKKTIEFIKNIFPSEGFIPLQAPVFSGNEKKYISNCIDSTFVSSVGRYVDQFEEMVKEFTGVKYAIATTNGTAALHLALVVAGVKKEDEVLTQALSFVATTNAIKYTGANPVFIDVSLANMGMCPDSLQLFLTEFAEMKNGECYNKLTGKRIRACVPMHTFGFPCDIKKVVEVCTAYNILVVEDAAESLGSFVGNVHTGNFGTLGVISFNGNKVITTGGGGVIITNNKELAEKAKYLSTTAKVPHKWEYFHDELGYNYRMPNINAAIGCAQMEGLVDKLKKKRDLFEKYKVFFDEISNINLFNDPDNDLVNYWLITLILPDQSAKEKFLEYSNSNGVMTRPSWQLLNTLPMYINCQKGNLDNSEYLSDRVINIPSSIS